MNQNLAQVGKQIAGIWKQLGLNQKISVSLASFAVIVGVIALVIWSRREDFTALSLQDTDESQVTAVLDAEKIPYRQGNGVVLVPADKYYRVRALLAKKSLNGKGKGWDLWDEPGWGKSDKEQQIKHIRALQGELSKIICQLDEVRSASVSIAKPETRLVSNLKPTASVMVITKNGGRLSTSAAQAIQFLVGRAVDGMQVQDVTVIDTFGSILPNDDPNTSTGMAFMQLGVRRDYEKYLIKKLRDVFEPILGANQFASVVSVELNFDTLKKELRKVDPDAVLVNDTVRDEKTDSVNGAPSLAAGTATNSNLGNTNAPNMAVNNSKNSSTTKEKVYETSKTIETLTTTPGAVSRVSASLAVATKYEGTGKDRKAVPRPQKDLDSLKKIALNALAITNQSDLTFEEISFNDQPALEMTQQMDKVEKRQFWGELANKALYPLLALGVLGAFWKSMKKTPIDSIPIGIPLGQLNGNAGGGGNGHGNRWAGGVSDASANPWGRSNEDSTVVTVEVLNQLIKENPANMTQAVRAWLTRSNTGNKS
jgi:flagellar M-ring protein FliF